jgi:anti-sigma B factor antagonist
MTGQPDFGLCDEPVDDNTHLFALRGEVDSLTAPRLGRQLIRVTDEGRTRVVVDLSRVTFIDSTGLSVLLNGLRQLTSRQGRLLLVCPSTRVLRPFEIAGLTERLDIFRSREEALGQLAAG